MPKADKKQQNAHAYLKYTLESYGIDGLDKILWSWLQQGFTQDRILVQVQETKEWKQRFAANEARRKKGLPVLSPAEYIGAEASYRQILQQAGVPKGFYDSRKDFQKWLENDVSPNEISQRVKSAQKLIEASDPYQREKFREFYTDGDMVAYALDPKRTAELLEKQVTAAGIAGEGKISGFSISQGWSERLAERGLDAGQSSPGFNQARQLADNARRLSAIYAGVDYGDEDALAETFFDNADAASRRRRLASQERAAFSGRSGLGDSSLSNRRAGTL